MCFDCILHHMTDLKWDGLLSIDRFKLCSTVSQVKKQNVSDLKQRNGLINMHSGFFNITNRLNISIDEFTLFTFCEIHRKRMWRETLITVTWDLIDSIAFIARFLYIVERQHNFHYFKVNFISKKVDTSFDKVHVVFMGLIQTFSISFC